VDYAVLATLATFLLGTVFYAGKLAARIEKLEEWRSEVRAMHAENIDRFDRLDARITELAERRHAAR
jgi:hypothetical protein